MAVVLDKANVVLVDKDGNRATVTSLTDNDLNKLSVGLSDVSDLKTRIKAVEDNGYVSYNSVQTLDEAQRSQAQANMDAPGLSVNNTFTGNMTVEANVKADSMTLNTRSDYAKLSASTNDHGIKLLGGSSVTTGASIALRGSTATYAPNTFTVSASKGVSLAGSKDGSLTWNSENVVRKVNNLPADASGNVLLGTEKSTFNKVVYDTGYFSINTDATYNFDLTGSDLENVSKDNINIRLVAKVTKAHNGFQVGDIAQLTPAVDTTGQYDPDYVTNLCTYIRGNILYIYSSKNDFLSIVNNPETGHWLSKYRVKIKAVLTAFIPDDGSILLIAEDQTNTSKLIGLPDGTLTWGDKNIVRSVNNVNADENGNVAISSLIPNQIIQSPVPLTDANLHLLDGALLSGSGAYADYIDLIAELFNGGTASSSFCTEAEWQTSNTNYGFCNKFVYDSVANTVRLPKVNSEHGALIKSYFGGSDGYRIYEDGWCEQWGRIIQGTSSVQVTFAIPYKDTNYSISYAQGSEDNDYETGVDAIKTGSLATTGFIVHRYVKGVCSYWHTCGYVDLSDLQVSPIYEYIVIGTISKTDIQVNIDNVMSDLALKADKDLSNVSGIVRSVNSYRFIYWETTYFDIASNGLYSFDLSNTDFANISKDAVNVQMIAKVKTAQNGYKVGDYVFSHFANYVTGGSAAEIGSTPYISDNVLSIRFGNDSWFVDSGPNGATSSIDKRNVQVKLILTSWIKEV